MKVCDRQSRRGATGRINDRAQSEVVGGVLLVALVVVTVSIAGVAIVEIGTRTDDGPRADVDARVTNESVSLVHNGGDSVPTDDLNVTVLEDGVGQGVTWGGGTVDGDGDDRFGPGEIWNASVTLDTDSAVRVILADTRTSTILVDTTVSPDPAA